VYVPIATQLNPFSHGSFHVSRLNAVGHIDNPKKGNVGEKEDDSSVRVCASDSLNKSRQTHSYRVKEVAFHVFCYNFACIGLRF
jgi:hypothetical protein